MHPGAEVAIPQTNASIQIRMAKLRSTVRSPPSFATPTLHVFSEPVLGSDEELILHFCTGSELFTRRLPHLYQVNVTILRWLNLGPDTALELEAGEDIDTVRMGSDGRHLDVDRVFEQLKQLAGSLTLRSGDTLALRTSVSSAG
jgi:hypothetical protein